MIYSFLNKYHYDPEEYYGLAAIGLCRATRLYDGNKGAFSTYAYKAMLTMITNDNKFKSRSIRIPEHLIDSYNVEICNDTDGSVCEFLDIIPSNIDIEREVIGEYMFNRYLARLDDLSGRDKLVFWLLLDGYTHREIGKIIGCHHSIVRPIKNKIIRRMERERVE